MKRSIISRGNKRMVGRPRGIVTTRLDKIKRLVTKYGDGIIKDFELLHTNPYWNLVDIGNKYGFTRQRAKQIYKLIYIENYGPTKVRLTKERREAELACKNDPRHKHAEYKPGNNPVYKGVEVEKLFFDECQARNINIELVDKRAVDFKINGYWVDVKSSWRTSKIVGNYYFRYSVKQKQIDKCHFIACYHMNEDKFFIIPIVAVKSVMIYITKENKIKDGRGVARNKYWEFRDAWHLLQER